MQAHNQVTVSIVLIVIGAGALHAVWNAIAKYLDDRLAVFALIGVASTVGGGAVLAVTGLPYRAAIGFAAASAAIHIGYDLGLMNSYRLGAFNQVYPIARGTSPLVVAIGAYFLAGERLGIVPLAGIAVLAGGLASLALSSGRVTRSEMPAVGAALLTGLTIAGYTLVDGLGVRRAHDPYAYAALLFLLMGPVFPVVAAFRRPVSWLTGPAAAKGLLAGALSLVAYGTVLWAQTRAPLAEVAAIRETGVVFAALIGMKLFAERFGIRRLAAALLVAAGIVLISA
ncbi:MAG TPA: DMT family transporter [Streptosporangiaceae bacterium]|nr:DMT family transporter [Streptosporangiaceae bacterium]